MSKLNLEVARGNGFNEQNRFAIKFDIKNYDTSSVPLSGLRVVAYSWLQYRNILNQFTSGVNSVGKLAAFTSSTDILNGIGQTGLVNLNLSATIYRVYHNVVNSSKIAPQLTLNAPNGQQSHMTVVSYANATDTYFDIVLNDVVPVPGYTVTWFLPGTFDDYTGTETSIGSPNITIEKISEYIRIDNRKYDSRIIYSWYGNSNLINPNWGIKDTDVYIQLNPQLYPSSFMTSSWYSRLDDINFADDPYFILEQWNGSSWEIIQEYSSSNTLDNLTGYLSTDTNFIKIVNSGVGNNKSVYISTSGMNPISTSSPDKDLLCLWSKNYGNDARRSLIKFETSSIPTSSTGIKNAILRLNVNSLTNAWNHFSTNGHVAVHRVTQDWIENEASWTSRKSGTPWNVSGGDYDPTPAIWVGNSNLSNSFTSADSNNQFWLDFDVTDFVDYWRLNPSENYGFLVKLYDFSNENNSSNIKWNLNSGRLSSSGTILGYPQLLISYKTYNSSGSIPEIEFKQPNDGSNLFNPTFEIDAESNIDSGIVENVELYYRQSFSVNPYQLLGELSSTNNSNWYGNFNSLSAGSYEFLLKAYSDFGVVGDSNTITLNFQEPPQISVSLDSICHDGVVSVNGSIDQSYGIPVSGTISFASQFIPTDKKITCLIEDKYTNGVVWIGTDGNGIYRVDKSSITNRITSFKTSNSSILFDKINDIEMDSNGILWISYFERGIGIFDSKNWNSRNSNDWYVYDYSNSPLSAYSSNLIDICDIHIDEFDNKWFALTWQSQNSILKVSGNSFNSNSTQVFNINAYPRKISNYGSTIYVSTNDNRIFVYNGSWTSHTLTKQTNINDIDVDSNNVLWFVTDSGMGNLNGSTLTELDISATPEWPYGLKSGSGQLENRQGKSIYIDGSNQKWMSFSTGNNNEYNGGVVRYAWDNFNPIGLNYYFEVFDNKRYSGDLSNNIIKTIKAISDAYVWIASEDGLSNINGYTRTFFSNQESIYPFNLSGTNFQTQISNPIYGNQELVFDFFYGDGQIFTSSVFVDFSRKVDVQILYPNSYLNTVNSNVSSKILEYNIDSSDTKFGAITNVKVQKAPTQNGPWNDSYTFTNSLQYPIYETLSPEDFYYIKVYASNASCSGESNVYAVYGNNISTIYLNPISGTLTTQDEISFGGYVQNNDFQRQLNVNGNSYIDSLKSVEFGYNTSAGFVSIGFGDILNKVDNTQYFNFDWSTPVAGISALSAISITNFGTTAISEITFNSITIRPTISIINPTSNQTIPLLQNFVLNASTSYLSTPVSALNYYIKQNESVSSIGAAIFSTYWTKSFPPSSYGPGNYSIFAKCVDDNGLSAISNEVDITINSLPSVLQVSDLSATHSGLYTFQIKIDDSNLFYGNRVEIISAGNVYTSGFTNGFGDFVWNWLNPPIGITNLSAKIYDGNPSVSSDYIVYPFTLNLNQVSVDILDFNYPKAKLNGAEISPSVFVITTDTDIHLSASVSGTNVGILNYWLCEYNNSTSSFIKKSILTSAYSTPFSATVNLPSSKYYSGLTSEYKFLGIVAEVSSTNGSKIDSEVKRFYVKEQSISGDIYNSVCSNPIIFNGKLLDSDLPYISGQKIIDNSISAYIFDETNSTNIGALSQTFRSDEYIPVNYSWSNPTSSTSAISLNVVDQYGISSTFEIDYGGIQTQPEIQLLSATNFINQYLNTIFLVSAGNIQVSASTSANKIKELNFRYYTSSWNVVSADVNKVGIIPIFEKMDMVSVAAYVKTSGNCEDLSTEQYYIPILPISANIYPDNCSTCYCNGGRLRISGSIIDPNFENPRLMYVFGRSISAYLYDNFNNLISDISSQVNSNFTFDVYWENPVVGTSSIYIKIIDNNGVDQRISKILYRSIFESPNLDLISPIDYSISSTKYRQDQSIYFASVVSSTDLIGVKYYVNGQLKSIQKDSSNNFLFDWNEDKLPGTYNISAVAINSNGCYSIETVNIMVVNSPVVNFIYPVENSYYQSGNVLSAYIDTKASNPAIVSAVNVIFNNSTFSATYNSNSKLWTTELSAISSAVSNYELSAISYDTLNQQTIKVISINVSNAPIFNATISGGISANTNFNTIIPIYVSGYSPNSVNLSSVYLSISGNIINIPNVSGNVFSADMIVARYLTPSMNNQILVTVIDDVGAVAYNNLIVYVNPFTGLISYPIIKNIGSDPINKVTFRG